ncbi:hypothetical protein SS50377_27668 [Spironucleus salmonicida]|uniref:Uncharacterized protein n=1 Tax=Spironucleus salmonicida TaxID=348837 RepID=V6LPL2_9EUKA|nr:hypothetical protein SS50377_27668 [Spironucleus salmonicida]|eukprot:EST46555.1 hypothetical protein SS50377_13359 [Spironucleus salmonicida]
MDLPNFEINDDVEQQKQMDMFSQILSGASAPSNSLLAASLETFSYKANALQQQTNSEAPTAEELLQKLMQCQQQVQPSVDLGVYCDGLDYSMDSQALSTSFTLATAAIRAEAEKQFNQQISSIHDKFFQKLRMTNVQYIKEFLTSFDSFAEGPGDEHITKITNIKYASFSPNNIKLAAYYIQNDDVELSPTDFPGFALTFIFQDDSELDIQFRLNPETQALSDAKVIAITGYAAEVLGLIVKKRVPGFFADVVPFTQGEISILSSLIGQQQVKDRIEKSYKHCKSILTKLSGMY